MLTKKQVFDAAMQYAHEQNPDQNKAGIEINDDFIAGARWAAACLDTEIMRLRSENELLTAENRRLFEQAAALQAENGVLRGQINSLLRGKIQEMKKQ